MNNNPPSEETLLEQALTFASPEARDAYLRGACGGDEKLRARVQALIEAHNAAGGFLSDKSTAAGPSVATQPELAEGAGSVIGRYKLLQQIGEGGMGVVYMAEQSEPVRRRVALKIIKLGMDTKSVIARFEAERQALALMDHPNIAKVLDAGSTETGRPYFVMELVRGIKITEYSDQNNLPTVERLRLFIQVCHAIQHAHQKGIIHRDIKPSNILVSLHDGVPVPVVIDFGIAKATEQKLTEKTMFTAFEQFIGTPAYMSPEQAEMSRLDIDTRTDIYSLGVLLYELLTGKTPFDTKELLAEGLEQMRRTIREKEPARPSTRLSTMLQGELTTTAKRRQADAPKLINLLRGDLDWIVMKALEKDRTRRYDTANGFAQDIQRHLGNEPVAARPPSTIYRLQKAWRRNRIALTSGAAVAIALVIGIGISTWQAVVATRAKTEAIQAKTRAVTAQKEAERSQQAEKAARLRADEEKAEAAHNLYVANMTLASQCWEESNLGRLQQALEDTKDSPYRGFEWYYWQKQTHLALKTFRALSRVRQVAFSPDGQRIVSGSFDRAAHVWDVASGRELFALKGHTDDVGSVAYSQNGQRIATGSEDGTARIWDSDKGKELLTLNAQGGAVSRVEFSPDGKRVVAATALGTIKMWEVSDGRQLLQSYVCGTNGYATWATFSSDGKRIATASLDGSASVWDANTGLKSLALRTEGDAIDSLAFSPDGRWVVTSGRDWVARVWDASTGRESFVLKGHRAEVYGVAFSPDSQRIVTSSGDRTAKLWETASGRELLTLKGHSDKVYSVAFSLDGQRVVTGCADNSAKLWEVTDIGSTERGEGGRLTLRGHTSILTHK